MTWLVDVLFGLYYVEYALEHTNWISCNFVEQIKGNYNLVKEPSRSTAKLWYDTRTYIVKLWNLIFKNANIKKYVNSVTKESCERWYVFCLNLPEHVLPSACNVNPALQLHW